MVVVVVVCACVCVCVGGGSHFKIKGCGGNACPPTLILACVHSTLRLVPHKSAHRGSRPEIIGRHLRASNEMIHGDFGIMILILRL